MAPRTLIPPVILVLASSLALGYDLDTKKPELSISGVISGASQCGSNGCYAAMPVQPEMSMTFEESHQLFVKVGLATGNAQNAETPFNIAPWAADLEDDVTDIDSRSQNHVLNAWYRHTASLGAHGTFETSVGIIDAADHLDGNAFSNDEYGQFMNSALVNGPNAFLPSYDRGLALSWTGSHLSVRGVYMNVGANDDGNEFDFLGVQLGYRADTRLGEGNYRVLVDATDDQFYDPTGTTLESRSAVMISCDQQLGQTVGAFVRIGTQGDAAAIDYGSLYSGGIDINGRGWGRERDNIGIGYAYLHDGNGDLLRSQVMEFYYRVAVHRMFSITGDAQYMRDDRPAGGSPRGFIFGLRLTAEF